MKNAFKHIVVIALIALASSLTIICRVDRHAEAKPAVNLSTIPTVIGEWRMVKQDRTLGAKEEKFLDDVLIRTYQRPDGKAVMLAVACGADQRKKFTVHLPEVCYKASGCKVTSVGQSAMTSPTLNLKQMVAVNPDASVEAVQYWIAIGGKIITSDMERKWKQAYYGMFGANTSGVLVRVSSQVNHVDHRKEYRLQEEFISELHKSLSPQLIAMIYGK